MRLVGGKTGRRRPLRVRELVLAMVLLPTVVAGTLLVHLASASWNFRAKAMTVQKDSGALDAISSARVALEDWVFAAEGITYAWDEVHLTPAQVQAVIGVDFLQALPQATGEVAMDPQLRSGIFEQADQSQIIHWEPSIASLSMSFFDVDSMRQSYETLVNDDWTTSYEHLLSDTVAWQPPGAFFEHVTILQQTFRAYLYMLSTLLYSNFVLNGHASASEEAQYFGSVEGVQSETANFYEIPGFPDGLGPQARSAWEMIESDPHLIETQNYFTQLAQSAVAGGTATFAGPSGLTSYENAFRYIQPYMHSLGQLLHAESSDLAAGAAATARGAQDQFAVEVGVLGAITLVVLFGSIVLARALTRPVSRLARRAAGIRHGMFHADPLPEKGPFELAEATRAFNEMAITLHALEEKAVAMATEDLNHPVLHEPLPGRVGRALQAAVDQLTYRVRQRENERQSLQVQAWYDSLTGLLNRNAVVDIVSRDMHRRKGEGELVAVIFVDLDGLKTINDTYGHEAGDAAIQAAGVAIKASTREGDAVARLGGDEFLVVAHIRQAEDARLIAEGISARIRLSVVSTWGGPVRLSSSVGVEVAEQGSDTDPLELIRRADSRMYEIKRRHHLAGVS